MHGTEPATYLDSALLLCGLYEFSKSHDIQVRDERRTYMEPLLTETEFVTWITECVLNRLADDELIIVKGN